MDVHLNGGATNSAAWPSYAEDAAHRINQFDVWDIRQLWKAIMVRQKGRTDPRTGY